MVNAVAEKDRAITLAAGKAIERGLSVEQKDDTLVVRYESESQKEEDHLHRQAIRALVARTFPNSKPHTMAINNGFMVEIDLAEPEADEAEAPEAEVPEISSPSDQDILNFLRNLVANSK